MAKTKSTKNTKDNNKKKKDIEIVKNRDDSIEVAIRKNPDRTPMGKIVAWGIIIGFVILPIITLILSLINNL